ncbi:MAG: DUF4270 domain-containing protein [Paludibacteraceae bacterium]|nr:DUF4270 domain-containing protein [Paludibacteraceae bacterium]
MKRSLQGLILCFCLCICGCTDDLQNAGQVVLDDDDAIVVCADTFDLSSDLRECANIISDPDSFLIGEIENKYGTMRAEVLTQLACPEGFSYPDNAEIDSICLHFYYRSWTGDGKSPLAIDVYQIDVRELNLNSDTLHYTTDVALEDYCSLTDSTHLVQHQRIILAGAHRDSVYSSTTQTYVPAISFRLSDDFCKRFFAKRSYTTQADFNKFFKGLYICTNFGSATVLNLTDINMGVYYHFSYPKAGTGKDTVVADMKAFYANAEINTINRFEYLNKSAVLNQLRAEADSVNFVIAPAGVYTSLCLPMRKMDSIIQYRINEKWYPTILKRPYVNLAEVRVDVLNGNSSSTPEGWTLPATQMLLIKDNRIASFFANKELPSDTVAILSSLQLGTDSLGLSQLYYSFDISTLLTNQLRHQTTEDTLRMTLVPVSIETTTANGTSVVVAVKQSQTISATKIRSAQDARSPMTLKVVYSGFQSGRYQE